MSAARARAMIAALLLLAGAGAVSAAGTGTGAAGAAGVAQQVEDARRYLRGSERAPANLPKAFHLFSGAAKAGDPMAAYYLAMMYKNGMAVARDVKAAAHWLQFAANRQMPAAMFALANLHLSGDGVERDDQAARRLIEKAADLEYPEAVMAMAIGLRDGSMGFDRNEALAETQMRFANRALAKRPPAM